MRFRRITEYKKYAGKHPDLNSCETLRLRGVGVYVVEDVDEDKKECDQKSHSIESNPVLVERQFSIVNITCQVRCLGESRKKSKRPPRTALKQSR